MQLFDVTSPIAAAFPAAIITGYILVNLLSFHKGGISESSILTKLAILTLLALGVGSTLFVAFINIFVVIFACIYCVPVVVVVNECWKIKEKERSELEREELKIKSKGDDY